MPLDSDGVMFLPQSIPDNVSPYPGAPASYVTPEIETVRYTDEKLQRMRNEIIFSGTGLKEYLIETMDKTATETMINHKSLEDRVGERLDNVEFVETFLTNTVALMHNGLAGSFVGSSIKYGRKLNIRDENTILAEISEAKTSGMPNSHIMNLQKELIIGKFRNSSDEMERNLLLTDIEPFCGYSVSELTQMKDYMDRELMTIKVRFNELINALESKYGKPIHKIYEKKDREKQIEQILAELKTMVKEVEPIPQDDAGITSTGDPA
jgi:hypothetical protein